MKLDYCFSLVSHIGLKHLPNEYMECNLRHKCFHDVPMDISGPSLAELRHTCTYEDMEWIDTICNVNCNGWLCNHDHLQRG